MIFCECGYKYEEQPGEKCLSAIICPNCKRKMKRGETWLRKLGDMTVLEAKENEGKEGEYLKKRMLRDGY